jgi:threonine dehydrogenase-like Zn-dependent dehydrogenase
MSAQAIFHVAPHTVQVRDVHAGKPGPGELLVRAVCSAISPGTESLIFRGGVPEDWKKDEGLETLEGDFRYPFKYGYALVGEVIAAGSREDRRWEGRWVFVFHPHQAEAVVDKRCCYLLPEGMPADRALFLANMESALNLVMDAAPLAGERGMVCGQGIVGLLTMAVLSQFPLEELIAADPIAPRRELSERLGASLVVDPSRGRELAVLEECLFDDDQDGLDFAIEVSGQIEALNQAIRLCGFDSRIVVGSWYGRNAGLVDLGGHFHRRRVKLISSQVSTVNPALSGRWSKGRRLALAVEWLDRIAPEQFITHRFGLSDCQNAFEMAADRNVGALQVIFEY